MERYGESGDAKVDVAGRTHRLQAHKGSRTFPERSAMSRLETWPGESPVRLFLWGAIIVALGSLTILGYVHLFGV